MVVPYGDPGPTHYFKNAFDAGENGVGIAASSLTLGCDCLGEIRYFDATVSNGDGDPVPIPNAICIHEEDVGVLWRHIEWRTGEGEVRRARRLVISSFSAIGNYDYGFFWYLQQDGTISFEVKLTGVLSTGAVAPGETPAHGVLVAPGLNAMVTSTTSTCASTSTSTAPRTRSSRSRQVDAPRAGEPARERVRGRAPAAEHRARGQAARRPGLGPLVGDREPAQAPPARARPSATGSCRARTPGPSPSPTRR